MVGETYGNDNTPISFGEVYEALEREDAAIQQATIESVVDTYGKCVDTWASKQEKQPNASKEARLLVVKLEIFFKTLVEDFIAQSKVIFNTKTELTDFKKFREDQVVTPYVKYIFELKRDASQQSASASECLEVIDSFENEVGGKYGPLGVIMDKVEYEYRKSMRAALTSI